MDYKDIVCSKISYREFREYCEQVKQESKVTKEYILESIARYILLAMWVVLYISFINLLTTKISFTNYNIIIYIACTVAYISLIKSLCFYLFPLYKQFHSKRRVMWCFKIMRMGNILQIQDMLKGQEKVDVEYMDKKKVVIRYLNSESGRKLIVDDCPMFIKTSIKTSKIDFSWIDDYFMEA